MTTPARLWALIDHIDSWFDWCSHFDDLANRQFVSAWREMGSVLMETDPHWDVNDFLLRMRQCAPQRRWMTVNTNFFGPDFSLSALIGVPLDVLRRTLKQHDWLAHMTKRKEYRWIHRPKNTEHLRIRALSDSTDGGHVVWFWMDLYGEAPTVTPGDMIKPSYPLRRGWDQLLEDEQRESREAVAVDSHYGELAPPGGWPSREEIDQKLSARARMTRRSGSTSTRPSTRSRASTASSASSAPSTGGAGSKRAATSPTPKTPPKAKKQDSVVESEEDGSAGRAKQH